jgi:hypothetical protein
MYVNTQLDGTTWQFCIRKEQEKGKNGGKIEWKFSEVNTRAMSRGQNEFLGKLKMVAGDVISIER